MSGKKGRSGRPRSIANAYKELELKDTERIPLLYEAIYNKSLTQIETICPNCGERILINSVGDKDCAFYYMDRRLGRPRQAQDLTLTRGVDIDPVEYKKYALEHAAELDKIEGRAIELLPEVTGCEIKEENEVIDV